MPDIKGPISSHWRRLGAERGPLGEPITENIALPAGEIVFFKYGCLWTGRRSGKVLYADLAMPMLGRPMLFSLQQPTAIMTVVTAGHRVAGLPPQTAPTQEAVSLLRGALEGRFFLRPVGEPTTDSALVPLAITRERLVGLEFALASAELGRMRDRQLYDIVLRLPDGGHHILSHHSVYPTSSTWENFSFVHATDIHVASRIDKIHATLKRLAADDRELEKAVANFHNWNDNFCNFIRYANRLHARKELDFILATGDLVDYLFETGDTQKHAGGNFAFFKSLVLGQGTFSGGETQHEELRVPIFTTLGNHDYRPNPYRLLFRAVLTLTDAVKSVLQKDPILGDFLGDFFGDVLDEIGIGKVGTKAFDDAYYTDYNLTENEAKILEGGQRPNISGEAAGRMVLIDTGMRNGTAFYFREINRSGSYDINLGGRHRIVMIDTRHDSGVTVDPIEGIAAKVLGLGATETVKFARGFVNSQGFRRTDHDLVRKALENTKGLVIVGMHAPPLCHFGPEFSHFFRETEHRRAAIADTIDFLLRNGGIPPFSTPLTKDTIGILGPLGTRVKIRNIKPSQIRGWRVDRDPFFRKAPSVDISLNKGTADNSHRFLLLCVGAEVGRKVNLVLCGHKHSNFEYRLRFDSRTKEFEYFLDYYTETPSRYYSSREFEAGRQEVRIFVKQDLTTPGPLTGNKREVPPFPDPLNSTVDPAAWWKKRSPLIIQTPSLGPIDKNQRDEENENHPKNPSPKEPAFQGVRLIEVLTDVIRRIRLVELDEIRREAEAEPPFKIGPTDIELGPGKLDATRETPPPVIRAQPLPARKPTPPLPPKQIVIVTPGGKGKVKIPNKKF